MRGPAAVVQGCAASPPSRTARPAVAQRLAVGREFGISRKLTSGYLAGGFEESLARRRDLCLISSLIAEGEASSFYWKSGRKCM